jgi:hypothetical protein
MFRQSSFEDRRSSGSEQPQAQVAPCRPRRELNGSKGLHASTQAALPMRCSTNDHAGLQQRNRSRETNDVEPHHVAAVQPPHHVLISIVAKHIAGTMVHYSCTQRGGLTICRIKSQQVSLKIRICVRLSFLRLCVGTFGIHHFWFVQTRGRKIAPCGGGVLTP